jgi:hypothetical protein
VVKVRHPSDVPGPALPGASLLLVTRHAGRKLPIS